MTKTCHRAFQKGQEARGAHPLRMGAYKLLESSDLLRRIRQTTLNIAADAKAKAKGYGRPFGSCTSDDAATWLKSVPALIAHELAYNVIPAIEALAVDGVPDAVVRSCVGRAQAEAKIILSQCEAAAAILKQGVKPEYDRMKAGNSTLLPLLDAVDDLIETTLYDVRPWV